MEGPRFRIGDQDREAVLRVLQEAHGSGRLDAEELDERQDIVLAAKFGDELTPVLEDLPEGRHLLGTPPTTSAQPPVPHRAPTVPVVPPGERPRFDVAVMAGHEVVLPPGSTGMRGLAWWAGHDIYLAEAMGPGVTIVLDLHQVMAGHDIYVPPGVRIVDESVAIMAGNDIDQAARGDGSNGTLVLRGVLFWAGSDVHLDPAFIQMQS